jgi:hypothetical protein
MTTPKNRDIPAWAREERQGDLGWIAENLDAFSAIASVAFEDEGRGAIVVDTTIQGSLRGTWYALESLQGRAPRP